MIAIQNEKLCICLPGMQPKELREWLIKSIAASIRWRASYAEDYKDDDRHLMYLSLLLAELTEVE